jgi:hypothetical protein
LAAVSGPKPGSWSSCGRDLLDERGDVALELVDRERELAQAAQLFAGDPHAHRLLGAPQSPADPRAPPLREQGAARQPQLRPQIVQMPEQGAVELDAVTDEAFAMVDQEPQVELRPTTRNVSSSVRYCTGVVWVRPERRPVVCSSRTGCPPMRARQRPPERR